MLVEIDGSQGEGGGQILRTALFLSLLTRRPFRVVNLRSGRRKPGLKRQHLGILRALGALTRSEVHGATLGSLEVEFNPGTVEGGHHTVDFGTAGSISLFLQTVLPVTLLARTPTVLTVGGGTDVPFSPTMSWLATTMVPFLRPLAGELRVSVERRGFYPAGGGRVRVEVAPRELEPSPIDRAAFGAVAQVGGLSIASRDLRDRRVAERQARRAAALVHQALGREPDIRIEYTDAASPGSSITLWVAGSGGAILAGDALGARGLPAERVGERAAKTLVEEWRSGAAVDRHLADHLVPWLGISGGTLVTSEVTSHAMTNALVTELFLERAIRIDGPRITADPPSSGRSEEA